MGPVEPDRGASVEGPEAPPRMWPAGSRQGGCTPPHPTVSFQEQTPTPRQPRPGPPSQPCSPWGLLFRLTWSAHPTPAQPGTPPHLLPPLSCPYLITGLGVRQVGPPARPTGAPALQSRGSAWQMAGQLARSLERGRARCPRGPSMYCEAPHRAAGTVLGWGLGTVG